MSSSGQPSLRLLSLNVNGLRDAAKRRTLFNLLHRDRWDVVLLQETHHVSQAEGKEWIGEGAGGLRANWRGPSIWSHGTDRSRGVAVLVSPSAAQRVPDLELQHSSPHGRSLGVSFTLWGTPFTAISVYAPSTAASRPAFFRHQLLPFFFFFFGF